MIEVGDRVTVTGRVVSGVDNRGRLGVQFDGPGRLYSEVDACACVVAAAAPAPSPAPAPTPAAPIQPQPVSQALGNMAPVQPQPPAAEPDVQDRPETDGA